MRVCFTTIELFPDGIYGGFGRATRAIGGGLVRRGLTVSVVMPRRSERYPDTYELDGMTVHQFRAWQPWRALDLYRAADADVYHSQDTSLGTGLAMMAMPRRAHAVTFRDPMDERDWAIETRLAGHGRLGWALYRQFIDGPLVRPAVRRARGHYCAAECLRDKVVRKYGLRQPPPLLPTPVDVPASVTKASSPTVCFVGRWDARKRPERFFELARTFPAVTFIAVGGARDLERDHRLRREYGDIPNLTMTGFIDQFQSSDLANVLQKSWVLVNTSAREGLPNAFLEAGAHGCAILSPTDPDAFASRFGYIVANDQYREGLAWLLSEDRWRERGARAREFVTSVFATDRAMDAHVAAYRRLVEEAPFRRRPLS